MVRFRKTTLAALSGAVLAFASLAAPAAAATPPAPTPATAVYPENQSLTDAQASARMLQISANYNTVGQLLSDPDGEFIKIYAKGGTAPAPSIAHGAAPKKDDKQINGTASFNFSKNGSGAGGAGSVRGTGSTTIGDFSITNSWSMRYTAAAAGTVNKIKACAHLKAFGTIGSSGIGLVYFTDPCSSVAGKTNNYSRGNSFTAFTVYMTLQYDAIFYTPTGSFQVAG